MSEEDARQLSPLKLAYLGDTVWEMLIRTRLIYRGRNVRNMHRDAVAGVNAQAQAVSLSRLQGYLTDTEEDILRRGRNAHTHHPVPKHQDPADYQAATALEALIGYLYLTGQEDRLLRLFDLTQREEETSCPK